MYPRQELATLAARKRTLRAECAQLRTDCAAAAARVARPVAWLDQAAVLCRRVSPLLRLLPLVGLWRAWRSRPGPRA